MQKQRPRTHTHPRPCRKAKANQRCRWWWRLRWRWRYRSCRKAKAKWRQREEEEEEAEDDKEAELLELIRDFEALEEEQQDSKRLVRVVGQRLTNIRKVISIGQEWLLGRTERVAAGGPLGGYSPGYIAGLPEWHWVEPTLRRPHRKEKIALEALAEAMDKAKNLWRMQAVLSHTIDDLYAVGGAHAGGGGTRRLLARGPPEGRLQRRVSASGDTRGLAALRERGKNAPVPLPGVGAVVARQRLQPGGRQQQWRRHRIQGRSDFSGGAGVAVVCEIRG